jgi:hypothetical protein
LGDSIESIERWLSDGTTHNSSNNFDREVGEDFWVLPGREEAEAPRDLRPWRRCAITQDKNAIKFAGRLFVDYHRQFGGDGPLQDRLSEVTRVLEAHCGGVKGKINLHFFRVLFKESPFSRTNREIFAKVLGDPCILRKELYYNGNVKNKAAYAYACKFMRIRCRSAILSERAQTR